MTSILAHRLADIPAFFYWTAQGRYSWVALVVVCLVYVLGARRGIRAPRLFFAALLAATAALVVFTAAILRMPPGPASLTVSLYLALACVIPAALLYALAKCAPRALPVVLGLALALLAADAATRLAYARLIGNRRSLFVDFSQALCVNDLEAARQSVLDGFDPAEPMSPKLQGDWPQFVLKYSLDPAPALEFLLDLGLPAAHIHQDAPAQ